MNGGKEDCRRYNVQCTKYQVPGTKIPQKYDLGQNTNPYFVLRTWYLVQPPTSSFFNQRSAFDISKNLYKVQGTRYHVPCTPPSAGRQDSSVVRFGSEHESILCTSYLVLDSVPHFLIQHSTLRKVASSKYQVARICTRYQVPCTKIPQKYDLGQNMNPYFVLGTWYMVQPPTS
jgi:hypothetical protein